MSANGVDHVFGGRSRAEQRPGVVGAGLVPEVTLEMAGAVSGVTGHPVGVTKDVIKSVKPYATQDEYLYAMKEDLAEWLNALYQLSMSVEDFFDHLDTGIVICRHANSVQQHIAERQRLQPSSIPSPSPCLPNHTPSLCNHVTHANSSSSSSSFNELTNHSAISKTLSGLNAISHTHENGDVVCNKSASQSSDNRIGPNATTQPVVTSSTPLKQNSFQTSTLNPTSTSSVTPTLISTVLDSNCNLSSCSAARPLDSIGRTGSSSSLDSGSGCSTVPVPFKTKVQPGTFQARDNVSNFITWCRRGLGIPDSLLFETEDLVSRKNERNVVLCLLEVARRGARWGMLAPQLIQFEEEIDAEIKAAAGGGDAGLSGERDGKGSRGLTAVDEEEEVEGDEEGRRRGGIGKHAVQQSVPVKKPVVTVDMMSLDEMVRLILSECTCRDQFPMIRVSEGKYMIGDSLTLIFLRILRNHVMVRIGGGWDTLESYLDRHDPCRCNSKAHRGSKAFVYSMSLNDRQTKPLSTSHQPPAPQFLPSPHTVPLPQAASTCSDAGGMSNMVTHSSEVLEDVNDVKEEQKMERQKDNSSASRKTSSMSNLSTNNLRAGGVSSQNSNPPFEHRPRSQQGCVVGQISRRPSLPLSQTRQASSPASSNRVQVELVPSNKNFICPEKPKEAIKFSDSPSVERRRSSAHARTFKSTTSLQSPNTDYSQGRPNGVDVSDGAEKGQGTEPAKRRSLLAGQSSVISSRSNVNGTAEKCNTVMKKNQEITAAHSERSLTSKVTNEGRKSPTAPGDSSVSSERSRPRSRSASRSSLSPRSQSVGSSAGVVRGTDTVNSTDALSSTASRPGRPTTVGGDKTPPGPKAVSPRPPSSSPRLSSPHPHAASPIATPVVLSRANDAARTEKGPAPLLASTKNGLSKSFNGGSSLRQRLTGVCTGGLAGGAVQGGARTRAGIAADKILPNFHLPSKVARSRSIDVSSPLLAETDDHATAVVQPDGSSLERDKSGFVGPEESGVPDGGVPPPPPPGRLRRSASLQAILSNTWDDVEAPPEDEDLNARMELLFEEYRKCELGLFDSKKPAAGDAVPNVSGKKVGETKALPARGRPQSSVGRGQGSSSSTELTERDAGLRRSRSACRPASARTLTIAPAPASTDRQRGSGGLLGAGPRGEGRGGRGTGERERGIRGDGIDDRIGSGSRPGESRRRLSESGAQVIQSWAQSRTSRIGSLTSCATEISENGALGGSTEGIREVWNVTVQGVSGDKSIERGRQERGIEAQEKNTKGGIRTPNRPTVKGSQTSGMERKQKSDINSSRTENGTKVSQQNDTEYHSFAKRTSGAVAAVAMASTPAKPIATVSACSRKSSLSASRDNLLSFRGASRESVKYRSTGEISKLLEPSSFDPTSSKPALSLTLTSSARRSSGLVGAKNVAVSDDSPRSQRGDRKCAADLALDDVKRTLSSSSRGSHQGEQTEEATLECVRLKAYPRRDSISGPPTRIPRPFSAQTDRARYTSPGGPVQGWRETGGQGSTEDEGSEEGRTLYGTLKRYDSGVDITANLSPSAEDGSLGDDDVTIVYAADGAWAREKGVRQGAETPVGGAGFEMSTGAAVVSSPRSNAMICATTADDDEYY